MTSRPLSINASAIPVAGIGGIGMLVIAAIMVVEFPLARWVSILGALGGILVAIALVLFRRRRHSTGLTTQGRLHLD
jgi:LPXTG-motif cell wall-anchored protein